MESVRGVKIGNKQGRKWTVVANALKLGDTGNEFGLEKHETQPAWRIYVDSDGEKSYLGYRQDAPRDANLILETPNDNCILNDRFYFHLRLQPSGRLLFQPLSSSEKFIAARNDALLVLTGEIKEEDEWVIGLDIKCGAVQISGTYKIRDFFRNAGIISIKAEEFDQIPVRSSTEPDAFDWKFSGRARSFTLQVPNSSPSLYMQKDGNQVIYGSSASDLRMEGEKGSILFRIGDQYLSITQSHLSLKNEKSQASKWTLSPFRLLGIKDLRS